MKIEEREEGIEIGERKGKIDTAKNLKNMGVSIEQIAKASKLTEDEIEQPQLIISNMIFYRIYPEIKPHPHYYYILTSRLQLIILL